MSSVCQEKFQVEYPEVSYSYGNLWASDKSARRKHGTPGREGLPGGDYMSRYMDNDVFYNTLPPGMEIEDQELIYQPWMPTVTAGETDVSHDMNPEAARNGYTRKKMRPTDDLWTNEHVDAFYGDITVDGLTGFIERNNMLDRM